MPQSDRSSKARRRGAASPETFPAWLRRQLEELGWSQAEGARRLGVSTTVVSRWINGLRPPSPDQRERIADVLAVGVLDVPTSGGPEAERSGSTRVTPVDPGERIADRIRGMRLTTQQAATLDAVLDVWRTVDP